MIYTKELQNLIYLNYSDKVIEQLDDCMINNDHNKVRIILEEEIDDPILYDKRKIRESYKSTYLNRKKAYSLFMTNYIKYLDNASNNRRR
jgi:hypothetical protein